MSRRQPTLRQAEEAVGYVERMRAIAAECDIVEGGYWMRFKRQRYGCAVLYPVSKIDRRCDDCGCILLDRRDSGGNGFWYDGRWLRGDAARRDPRLSERYEPRHACLSCFNRVRPALQRAGEINELRLTINRVQREIQHAA